MAANLTYANIDTDSSVYEIEAEEFYRDFAKDVEERV